MNKLFDVKFEIDNIEKLQRQIEYVEKLIQMETNNDFQKYIQEKVLETVKEIARKRIPLINSTNQEYMEEYILRNQIKEIPGGFVLYNDFKIPAILSTKNTKNQDRDIGLVRNYDDGFNLALAFEYGVGIVGQNNPVNGAWAYNINDYDENGWYYKTPNGEAIRTQGYQGAEVYRYTAIEIKNKLRTWVNDYYNKEAKQ